MAILRYAYVENHDHHGMGSFYLLTLARTAPDWFTVCARYGQRTGFYGGRERRKYAGPGHREADRAFEAALAERARDGYREAAMPPGFRYTLSAEGVPAESLDPLLARVGYRAYARVVAPPAGRLVTIASIGAQMASRGDEIVVHFDERGVQSSVGSRGTDLDYYRLVLPGGRVIPPELVVGSGLAPATIAAVRGDFGGYGIVADVLELAGTPTAALPGAERLLLVAQVAGAFGLVAPTPHDPGRPPAEGDYMVALDLPHRPRDGAPSRFVVTPWATLGG